MNKRQSFAWILGLFLLQVGQIAYGAASREIFGPPEPSDKEKAALAAAAANPNHPLNVEPVVAKVTPEQAKSMLVEFQKAQNSQLKAIDHQDEIEISEMLADEKVEMHNWEVQQGQKKNAFFEQNRNAMDRKRYLMDQETNRKAHAAQISQERVTRRKEMDARRKDLQDQQSANLKKFQESLKKLEKPALELWP